MKMKTKIVILIVIAIILGIVLASREQTVILPKQVQIELGKEIPSDVSDYIYIKSGELKKIRDNTKLDVSGIDARLLGNMRPGFTIGKM